MVEVVRTNFAPIFSDFQFFWAIRAPIVAPPSDNFENCSIAWKGLFFRKNRCKYHLIGLQMPTLCLLEVTQLALKRSTADERYFQK